MVLRKRTRRLIRRFSAPGNPVSARQAGVRPTRRVPYDVPPAQAFPGHRRVYLGGAVLRPVMYRSLLRS
jgi:hypothetical protein